MKSPLIWLLTAILLLTADPARANPQSGSFESFDRHARSGNPLNVVFFGGPFTEGAGLADIHKDSWRERFQQFLVALYPRAAFHFDFVSMGDVGSKRAMFYMRELIGEKKPDLVFVDFLIEDGIQGENRDTLAAYEIILSDLVHGGVPVMQVLTGVRSVQGDFWKPVMPQRLRDYLEFVSLYRTGVGESYQTLHQVLASKKYTTADIWPDNAKYPSAIGHDLMFASLREGYLKAVEQKRVGMYPSKSVFAWYYKSREIITAADLPLPPGWTKLAASVPLATDLAKKGGNDLAVWDSSQEKTVHPLRVNFQGTMVAISGESDLSSLDFKVTIDGSPVLPPARPDKKKRVLWTLPSPNSGEEKSNFWLELSNRLAPGPHTLELTPVVDDSGLIGQLRIRNIFSAGE